MKGLLVADLKAFSGEEVAYFFCSDRLRKFRASAFAEKAMADKAGAILMLSIKGRKGALLKYG